MKTIQRLMIKYSDRLVEIHKEDDDGVSYWAALKPGWRSNLECTLVHERTIKELEAEIKNAKFIN